MTVSVVIPSFQNAGTLARTLESVLSQTYTDLEVIVADHSSTDGSLEVARSFEHDPRVRVLSTPAGGGAERNWNRVTDEATGSLIKLVCADDVLYPTLIERQVAALAAHPSAGIASSKRDLIDPADGLLLKARGLGNMAGLVPGPLAVRTTVRAGANLLGEPMCNLLRTDHLRKVGGWRATEPFLIDQGTYLRILRHADLVAIPEPLAAFRVSSTQWSVSLAAEQAKQAAALHARVRAEFPETVTRWDERLGNLQALRTAWLRRAAYFVWRKRMLASG
jgi:glycosyltransferase involved in cell wall biosynthesis